jgi:hypothetical protein
MPDVNFTNLLMVAVIALLTPLTLGLAPRLGLPAVDLEIAAGIVVGPQVLGWVEVDVPVSIVSLLGLAFLLFLAGLEIDLHRLKGQVMRLALVGYAATLVLGVVTGLELDAVSWVDSPGQIATPPPPRAAGSGRCSSGPRPVGLDRAGSCRERGSAMATAPLAVCAVVRWACALVTGGPGGQAGEPGQHVLAPAEVAVEAGLGGGEVGSVGVLAGSVHREVEGCLGALRPVVPQPVVSPDRR